MGIFTSLLGEGGIISDGVKYIFSFGFIPWVLIGFMIIAFIIGIIWWINVARKKKKQWTHKIRVRRLLQNGTLTEEAIHKARRFPLEKGVEVFEVDKPVLGSYLVPQPGEYTGINEFSIIIDAENRIYLNKGYEFNKEKESVKVSCVHAGIDVGMANMKDKWQQAHKVDKRITTAELIKAGLMVLGIVAVVILGIMGLKEWGQAQEWQSHSAQSRVEEAKHIADAVETIEKVVNTQQLQLVPMLKALYGTDNLAVEINKYREDVENET